jgi:hypothetical protein
MNGELSVPEYGITNESHAMFGGTGKKFVTIMWQQQLKLQIARI